MLKERKVIWFYGLPSAGKTTLSIALKEALVLRGKNVIRLDGDDIRQGVNSDLGYSLKDRNENVRRTAEIARLLLQDVDFVLCSFITPTKKLRERALQIIGEKNFIGVFVDCPFQVCIERDVKGLYRQALDGELSSFTGVNHAFEPPDDDAFKIETEKKSEQYCVNKILQHILYSQV